MATASASHAHKNFIHGEWVAPKSGKTLENRNPANTDEVIGAFPLSTQDDVDAAVGAAKAAYKTWRLTPA
ncbi:aldehyde dehydrogenase, partial [Pseudomonas sp. FW305-E2]|uniref:aldehyde dehydrogenase family protein n=1 Tax=Pseudomonas sp. FW305-E2 TaxID=2075558 RepID=UPI000CD38F92